MKRLLKYLVMAGLGLGIVPVHAAKHWPAPKTPEAVAAHRRYVLSLINEPHIRAFADMTAALEGTNKPTGYRMLFQKGHKKQKNLLFDSFADHPRKLICASSNGSELCTTAAGRYMFLEKTWDDIAWKFGAEDFSPINQDGGLVQLLIEREALEDVLSGRLEVALRKTKNIWASFPNAPYGQPTKSFVYAEKIFKDRLAYYQALRNQLRSTTKGTS